jgi:HAE1 family hydrophobic/amphiphilic exporter-1
VLITRFAYGKAKLAELEKNYKPDEAQGGPKDGDSPQGAPVPA